MTLTLVWLNEARTAVTRLRSSDPTAAKLVLAATRALAADPYPETCRQLGTSAFWRLHLGDLRVTYQVDDQERTVYILSVGQLPPPRRRS